MDPNDHIDVHVCLPSLILCLFHSPLFALFVVGSKMITASASMKSKDDVNDSASRYFDQLISFDGSTVAVVMCIVQMLFAYRRAVVWSSPVTVLDTVRPRAAQNKD